MKRTVLLLSALLSIGLVCGTAHGSFDPSADSFGVYFTADALWVETHVAPFTAFDGYLILANPVSEVDGFECTVTPIGGSLLFLSADLGPDALDVDASANGYMVGAAVPYPIRPAGIQLVHWQFMVMTTAPVHFLVGPATIPSLTGGLPVVTGGGELRRCGVFSGSVDIPVACINTSCTVSDEVTSFGAVKGLYR